MMKSVAVALLVLASLSHITIATAASQLQCNKLSQKSDREMGGCRSSYLNGQMTAQRAAQCCQYRLQTISTWEQCTEYFGPVDWSSLNESKREWGCG